MAQKGPKHQQRGELASSAMGLGTGQTTVHVDSLTTATTTATSVQVANNSHSKMGVTPEVNLDKIQNENGLNKVSNELTGEIISETIETLNNENNEYNRQFN